MSVFRRIKSKVADRSTLRQERRRPGSEADKATAFWANLQEYHLSNDEDAVAILRSKWIAEDLLPSLGIASLIEIGCNSGRNLRYLRDEHPDMRLLGIDVNHLAIEFARASLPTVQFELSDANAWDQPEDSWDCSLTMSVLDHIPKNAVETLINNLHRSCNFAVSVELWDGSEGERALYKYSWNLKSLYEASGFRTLRWEPLSEHLQYDSKQSNLWLYVGCRQFGE